MVLLGNENLCVQNKVIKSARASFAPQPKWFGQWPNEPKTMKLLESRLDTERLMS